MAGTVEGSRKAVAKIKESNPDFYREIALKSQESWKRNGRKPRGFAHPSADPRAAGAIGGRISKRRRQERTPLREGK